MRLKKLTLKNFRQYYGEQTLEIAGGNPEDTSNVTVVYGENGRGKTAIYRAIMFGLYGERQLEQDEYDSENRDAVIYLANLKSLEDARDSEQDVEVSVRVQFTHEDKDYDLQRYFQANMDNQGNVSENRPFVILRITNQDGNTEVYDDLKGDEIKAIIDGILDTRVKNYFLFDGERIERLTKASKTQREDVQRGIKNLLKIDNLFLVQAALQDNRRNLLAELKKVSTGDYYKLLQEIEDIDKKISEINARTIETESELQRATREKEDISRKLQDADEKRSVLEAIVSKENEKIQIEEKLSGLMDKAVSLTPTFSALLLKEEISALTLELDEKRQKGELPALIKRELIDRILGEMTCICGETVTVNTEKHDKLLGWLKNSTSQVVEKNAITLFGNLNKTAGTIQYGTRDLKESLMYHTQLEEQLELIERDLELLRHEAPESVNMTDFEYRDRLTEKIGVLKDQLRRLETDLQVQEELKSDKEQKRRKYTTENEIQDQRKKQLDLVTKSLEVLGEIIKRFEREIRVELHDRANKIFKELIDDAGKNNLSELVIRDNYTLDVLDWSGRPFLANISAGQRQVLSLAFITALAEVAGGSTTLELPLFMDTPFGRLSPDHRHNLVNVIPNITPQWILLVTGTEFKREVEARVLSQTGRWGKLYKLEAESAGVTQIRESSPQEFLHEGSELNV